MQRLAVAPQPGHAAQPPDRILQAALTAAALPVLYADAAAEFEIEHSRTEITAAIAKNPVFKAEPTDT